MTEWGCDAFNSNTSEEDGDMQARYIKSQWEDIARHSDICSGGLVFEWSDEWWKSTGSGNADNIHDTTIDWTGESSYTEDSNMNEEWWGINKIAPGNTADKSAPDGTYTVIERKAYITLTELWGGGEEEEPGDTIFITEPQNYPNPFSAHQGGTAIKFQLKEIPQRVRIGIYSEQGREVFTVSPPLQRLYYISWNGKQDGQDVETGIYLLRTEVLSPAGRTEVKYRKLLVVK